MWLGKRSFVYGRKISQQLKYQIFFKIFFLILNNFVKLLHSPTQRVSDSTLRIKPDTEVWKISRSLLVGKSKLSQNNSSCLGDVTSYENEGFSCNFDRIISIEMFEHMKNYEALLKKISSWLTTEGKLFVHIFTHKWKPYHFTDDWMARTFFTGTQCRCRFSLKS